MTRAELPGLSVVLALACAPPPVVPSADHANDGAFGVIQGNVIFSGSARGNVILLLFNAALPPPPQGIGRPLNFAVIDGSTLFSGATSPGPFSVPYTFGPVPAGQTYLLGAFLDADLRPASHGPDFVPWFSVTNQPGGGDVLGGYVDLTSPLPVPPLAPIQVPIDPTTGLGGAATQTSVVLDQSLLTTEPEDRPSFNVTGGPRLSSDPTLFTLNTETIDSDPVHAGGPFLLQYVDDDHDGVPDTVTQPNGTKVPLFWPKILVRKLDDRDPSGLHDENDMDSDGVVDKGDPDAKTYAYAGTDPDPTLPAAVILEASVVPTPAELAQLVDTNGNPDVTKFVRLTQMTLAVRQIAIDIKVLSSPAPLAPVPGTVVPAGRYAITVEQFTGQSWRLPNEMEPCPPTQTCPNLVPSDATQGFMLLVE